jgi:hypothetical protein
MTASFTEQMVTSYPLIGILSRGSFPSSLVGEGRVRGYPSSGPMLKRISPPSPTRGRRKKIWIRGFRRNDDEGTE